MANLTAQPHLKYPTHRSLVWLFIGLLCFGCSQDGSKSPAPTEAGLSAGEQIGSMPQLFLQERTPEHLHAHQGFFSPDGEEYFYTQSDVEYQHFVLMTSRRDGKQWAPEKVVAFSGEYSDHGASFAPGGKILYFASTRPLSGSSKSTGQWRLWAVERQQDGWSEPRHLAIPGMIEAMCSHPSITTQGELFFHVSPDAQYKELDLYSCQLIAGECASPRRLGEAIDSDGWEITPFVAAHGGYLLFTAYGRPDGFGSGDLYISFRKSNGDWQPASNLGDRVNTAAEESNPQVTADGRYLFFSRRIEVAGESRLRVYRMIAEGLFTS